MSDENNTKVLTPEQEEELKFKSKYPNSQKPGGSAFIQKMLHKGSKKYFDSGDYNMAKSKNKLLTPNPAASIPPTIASSPTVVTSPTNSVCNSPSTPLSLKQQQSQTNLNSNLSSSNSNSDDVVNSFQQKDNSTTITKPSVDTSPTIAASNINDVSISNDNDIIGHEIPTPECLPRKHSNIQSKLATTTKTTPT